MLVRLSAYTSRRQIYITSTIKPDRLNDRAKIMQYWSDFLEKNGMIAKGISENPQ